MNLANDLAALFRRDLTRLLQELKAFPDEDTLWSTLPGVSNSAGNLVLHLEGNLREYIGRQLGGVDYHRERDLEFSTSRLTVDELGERVTSASELITSVISSLSLNQLETAYPDKIWGQSIPTHQFLIHLHGHLNYHLGQIDYLRRITTQRGAIEFAGL